MHKARTGIQALQVLYSEREVGGEVGLPRHWMRDFFLASLCLETQENQEGLSRLQVGLLSLSQFKQLHYTSAFLMLPCTDLTT